MIRIEVICAHSSKPSAHDAKFPCDSTRNRSLTVDVEGTFDEARRKIERQAKDRGWAKWLIIPGQYKGLICKHCAERARGEI